MTDPSGDPLTLLAAHGALGLFVVVLAARLGAPVPAAPIVMLVGALAATRPAEALALFIAAVLGNLAGDAAWFAAGRRFGYRVLRLLCRISLSPDVCVSQSEALIGRWGGSAIVAGKFLPGISVVAAPMAGALGMSTRRFVAWDTLASIVWSGLYLGIGAALGDHVQRAIAAMGDAGRWLAVAGIVGVLGWLGLRLIRRRVMARRLLAPRITVAELRQRLDGSEPPIVVDVRSPTAREADPRTVPGARFIGLHELTTRRDALPDDREIVVYCNCPADASAAKAAQGLARHGRSRVQVLAGGLDAWHAAEARPA